MISDGPDGSGHLQIPLPVVVHAPPFYSGFGPVKVELAAAIKLEVTIVLCRNVSQPRALRWVLKIP
jgi:hypothetical protein